MPTPPTTTLLLLAAFGLAACQTSPVEPDQIARASAGDDLAVDEDPLLGLELAPDDSAEVGSACGLPPSRGPCGALIPRWYYDDATDGCRLFVYGGCGGNGNNFATRATCEASCMAPLPTCEQSADYGPCGGFRVRWFFDADNGGCRRFIYGGCGGNDNNFATRAACEAGCPLDTCELPASSGPCGLSLPRWHFDDDSGECRRFVYGGCGGNDNNFATLAACEARCDLDPCAACAADATCDGAACVCNPGFGGDGATCTPIDACLDNNGGCSLFATCTSTGPGTRTCTCGPGTVGNGVTCTPICEVSNGGCSPFATCTPAGAGRTCTCGPGTVGNGVTCTPICEVSNGGCSPFATCTPAGAGRICECAPGTVGDGETCAPVGCECPPPGNEPVCGVDGQTYGSACLAGCAGVDIDQPGECTPNGSSCAQPRAPGACNELHTRWYWDPALGACASFVYSGCGGNANNFESQLACEVACKPQGDPAP